jgi:hypothetical protein
VHIEYILFPSRIYSPETFHAVSSPDRRSSPSIAAQLRQYPRPGQELDAGGQRLEVQLSQLLFGMDFPYSSGAATAKGLEACGFSESELQAIYRGNVEKLLPRFAA